MTVEPVTLSQGHPPLQIPAPPQVAQVPLHPLGAALHSYAYEGASTTQHEPLQCLPTGHPPPSSSHGKQAPPVV